MRPRSGPKNTKGHVLKGMDVQLLVINPTKIFIEGAPIGNITLGKFILQVASGSRGKGCYEGI